jgi:hypothetical protein
MKLCPAVFLFCKKIQNKNDPLKNAKTYNSNNLKAKCVEWIFYG